MRYFLISLLLLIMSGCASLSEDACLTGDWEGIGYSDGLHGRRETRLEEHQQACAEYRVSIDRDLYSQGREAGLRVYCEPENGYRLGRDGHDYHSVCPAAQEPAFLQQYQRGYRLYQQEQQMERLRELIERQYRLLDKLSERMDAVESALLTANLSGPDQSVDKTRADLQAFLREQRKTLRQLTHSRHRELRTLQDLENQLQQARFLLSTLE